MRRRPKETDGRWALHYRAALDAARRGVVMGDAMDHDTRRLAIVYHMAYEQVQRDAGVTPAS